MKNKGRVFVAMSGGVDSSVSAALLKKDGYQVTGVFIRTWSPRFVETSRGAAGCGWQEERRDAMRVAARLKISLLTLDLEKEYKERVADYMITEYRAGRVPNPDVMCNKVIKFGGFFDFAMAQGADFVATGHYARLQPEVVFSAHGSGGGFATKTTSGFRFLCQSADKEKDQTYFLWTLTQRELSKTLFPIGHLQKPEVRRLAKKFGLPNAEKKDSQGLCFMGAIDVKDFLKHYIKEKKGAVLNTRGEKIGEHDGAVFYTLGERHGFVIEKKGSNDAPYYVVGKDAGQNILMVSNEKNLPGLSKKEILLKDVNWNQGAEPDLTKKYQARVRYRQPLETCEISRAGEFYRVIFKNPQIAAAGQSTVIYENDICLGGGIIV